LVALRRQVLDEDRHILHAQGYGGDSRNAVSDCTV
jgi:hypothetical protein